MRIPYDKVCIVWHFRPLSTGPSLYLFSHLAFYLQNIQWEFKGSVYFDNYIVSQVFIFWIVLLYDLWYLETCDCKAFLDGHLLSQKLQNTGWDAICFASICFCMLDLVLDTWPQAVQWYSVSTMTIRELMCSWTSPGVLPTDEKQNPGRQ